ncbi:MAG: molybdopterin molybdotransferase MoeA [Proteobacteria bacterium]|nr:molybdopterin molybdotransferase MoeA [Pseudomonadota bacterium]
MDDFRTQFPPAEFMAWFTAFTPLTAETVPLAQARGRVVAEPLTSREALPRCPRSLMDGYAVRAADTLACSGAEAVLTVAGEVATGTSGQAHTLRPGQAIRIWTGGELPQAADAVVRAEHTRALDRDIVAVLRPVAPHENVVQAGEDYTPGAIILQAGHRLRPQDLGMLAGLGIASAQVYRQPRVAIVSTGNELVAPDQTPPPGAIRNINSTTLTALVEEAGGLALPRGICPDNFDLLLTRCTEALREADLLLLTGGSSLGRHDCTRQVFAAVAGSEILVPGVSVRLGKPAILARQGNKALFGLPGHAASALVGFLRFVRPLIRLYSGLEATLGLPTIRAIIGRPIPSTPGREEYVRVRLTPQPGGAPPLAVPVSGKSGLLGPLVQAHGLLPIGPDAEELPEGAEVTVLLFP